MSQATVSPHSPSIADRPLNIPPREPLPGEISTTTLAESGNSRSDRAIQIRDHQHYLPGYLRDTGHNPIDQGFTTHQHHSFITTKPPAHASSEDYSRDV